MSKEVQKTVVEKIGLHYPNWLVDVTGFSGDWLCDRFGVRSPVQHVPRLCFDLPGPQHVALALREIEPYQAVEFFEGEQPSSFDGIVCESSPDGDIIRNKGVSLRLPRSGTYARSVPGPFGGFVIGDGDWIGGSKLLGIDPPVTIQVTVHADGPAVAQWTVTYSAESSVLAELHVRWALGADTLVVQEDIYESSEAAYELYPSIPHLATAYHMGAGEHLSPLQPMEVPLVQSQPNALGGEALGHLGHISYFGQWTDSWVGFRTTNLPEFIGAFSGWSSQWQGRGYVRPRIVQDVSCGAFLRLPLMRGRRVWGLVVTSSSEIDDSGKTRHLLNRRKNQYADIPLSKQINWQLAGPTEDRTPHLFSNKDLQVFRAHIASDREVVAALEDFVQWANPEHVGFAPAAIWKNEETLLEQCKEPLLLFAESVFDATRDGGYDRIIIFNGREAKRRAYDFDALWSMGILTESEYLAVQRALLLLAYVFVDPDYCRFEDFWAEDDPPSEGVREAMKSEMGDSPVPPNFAAEFFTTTAVIADLFPGHPMHDEWTALCERLFVKFVDRWFEPDGTYLESVNYHCHALNILICQIYGACVSGRANFLENLRIRGSFEQFLRLRTPVISHNLPVSNKDKRILAADDLTRLSVLPADGNSGENGNEQEWGEQLSVGAAIYHQADPDLSGRLMDAWIESGKVVLGTEHPLLTLLTLRPNIKPVKRAVKSIHCKSLGVLSRAKHSDGSDVWALLRAGSATHHMDFDQGNIHLIAGGKLLLGDHGYHTHDDNGKRISGCSSFLHNVVTFSDSYLNSSGYTGLEEAPEPEVVALTDEFDYVAHRIINTNYRRIGEYPYNMLLPAPKTVHLRRTLFVKVGYLVIYDTFDECTEPTTYRLHPPKETIQVDSATFVTGNPANPDLRIRIVAPREPRVTENKQYGPLWSFAVTQEPALPYITVLQWLPGAAPLVTEFDESARTLRVQTAEIHDFISFPEIYSLDVPNLRRKTVEY